MRIEQKGDGGWVTRFIEGYRERHRQIREESDRKRKDFARAAEDFQARMQDIETFPGTKAEFEEFKGEQYDYVNIPGPNKSVRGNSVSRRLNTDYYRYLSINYDDSIFGHAVELGADAIVRFSANVDGWGGAYPEGIPVKKRQGQENSQTEKPSPLPVAS